MASVLVTWWSCGQHVLALYGACGSHMVITCAAYPVVLISYFVTIQLLCALWLARSLFALQENGTQHHDRRQTDSAAKHEDKQYSGKHK